MIAHRHWRLWITATVGSAAAGNADLSRYARIAELELRGAPGGPDLTAPGMVPAGSWTSSPLAPLLIDDDPATVWAAYTNEPYFPIWWWSCDLGAPAGVAELALTVDAIDPDYRPVAFVLQFSDDGVGWENLGSYTVASWAAGGETKVFAVPEQTAPAAGTVVLGRASIASSQGTGSQPSSGGLVIVNKVTTGAKAVRVASGRVFVNVTGRDDNAYPYYHPPNFLSRMVIYADSGGHPASLVAVSDETQHNAAEGAGERWRTYAFPSEPLLQPNSTYHFGFIHSAAWLNGNYYPRVALNVAGQVSHSKVLAIGAYASGPPNPFSSTSGTDEQEYTATLVGLETDPVPAGRTLTVTFDGVSALGILLDGSTIHCSPPPHVAGTVEVVVTLDGVQSVGSYTYDPVTTVTFDGIQATEVVFLDANRIQCRTPAHAAGAVNVVADFGDGALTGVAAFTYEEEAPPEPPPSADGAPQVGVIT